MRMFSKLIGCSLGGVLLVLMFSAPAYPKSEVDIAYLYKLSSFSGVEKVSEVRLSVDRRHDEVYLLYGNVIRVFNKFGMETYRFGNDPDLGRIHDLVVQENGDLLLLSYEASKAPGADMPNYFLVRCNFRGEPIARTPLKGLPHGHADFRPQLLFLLEDGFLLVSRMGLKAVEADRNGTFRKVYDFAELLGIEEKDRPNTEIFGFSLDSRGNMLLTIPVRFQAYRITPEGKVSSFGKKGSSPGSFGIVNGIVADDHGNYLVADSLRSVVMVFDEKFRFITEFGGFGKKPANLVTPKGLAIGNSGKIYVTQMRKMGVSVFSVAPRRNGYGAGS